MVDRERVAQEAPTGSLADFPCVVLEPGTGLFRAHSTHRGPWWFGSDGSGRFDLPAPGGTCYLALDPESAVRERLGPVLGGRTALPESTLAEVVVSSLAVPRQRRVADLQSRRAAAFGVTRELETMVPYAVPQAWARALARARYEGVRYGPRFTPGPASAVALFGEAGAAAWPIDPSPQPAPEVVAGLRLWPTPRRTDLTVVKPPRTRTVRG